MPIDLTVKQALAKAIQLHKSGELNEAEQIYRAILKLEPKNSDANHNLGLIALSVGQLEAALPFLNKQLERIKLFHSIGLVILNPSEVK